MSSATAPKRAVNLSLTAQNVAVAKELGINLSDVADRAIADAVARSEREKLQARMDEEMERYNAWSAQGISVADEYGTL
ncbi:MAG: type II toxin-antitoxin system CcdA family antitoxin [Niveispirillum sp.]|nr:type II toxin-antitoxin system CcdA family antitoxin [Niveispirillum sp.]